MMWIRLLIDFLAVYTGITFRGCKTSSWFSIICFGLSHAVSMCASNLKENRSPKIDGGRFAFKKPPAPGGFSRHSPLVIYYYALTAPNNARPVDDSMRCSSAIARPATREALTGLRKVRLSATPMYERNVTRSRMPIVRRKPTNAYCVSMCLFYTTRPTQKQGIYFLNFKSRFITCCSNETCRVRFASTFAASVAT